MKNRKNIDQSILRAIIDPSTTGSFKDLCQKLIDLFALSIDFQQKKENIKRNLEKQYQNTIAELEEKNLEQ